MVEVDPIVLIAAGTAVVGFATVILCLRPSSSTTSTNDSNDNVKLNDQAEKGTSGSKGKKKSKTSKSKSKSNNNTTNNQVKNVVYATYEQVSRDQDNNDDEVENGIEESKAAADDEAIALVSITEEQDALLKKAKKAKETPEQKAARLERQKLLKTTITSSTAKRDEDLIISSYSATTEATTTTSVDDEAAPGQQNSPPPVFDGWAVVEDKRKVKTKVPSIDDLEESSTVAPSIVVAAAAAAVSSAPVVESATSQITVESRKVGLLIGQKGKTKLALQRATDTEITMPKVDKEFTGPVEIIVTGPSDGVKSCIHALNELVTKGYCNLLADADFHEGYVAVNPKHLPIIIGPKGSHIKAIEAHTSVKITTPTGFGKTTVTPSGENVILPSKVKIGLAGSRDKLTIARNLILELIKYQHTTITHPNIIHIEMEIAPHYYNFIIGSKGSEIKHIQANYKVTVIIPNNESGHENLLILGEEANVLNAEKHILKVIDKAETQLADRAKAEAEGIALGDNAKAKYAANLNNPKYQKGGDGTNNHATTTGSNATTNPKEHDRKPRVEKEEPEEDWVKDFAPRQRVLPLGNMLPATAKFAAAPSTVVAVSPTLSESVVTASSSAVTSEVVASSVVPTEAVTSASTENVKVQSTTESDTPQTVVGVVVVSSESEYTAKEKVVVDESVEIGADSSSSLSASAAWVGGRSTLAATAKLY